MHKRLRWAVVLGATVVGTTAWADAGRVSEFAFSGCDVTHEGIGMYWLCDGTTPNPPAPPVGTCTDLGGIAGWCHAIRDYCGYSYGEPATDACVWEPNGCDAGTGSTWGLGGPCNLQL